MLSARPSTDYFLMAVYSYAESFRVTQYGTGAAIAVVLVGLLMLLSIFYVRQMIKITDNVL
jgi:ABC-type sugar transport system permease subunit